LRIEHAGRWAPPLGCGSVVGQCMTWCDLIHSILTNFIICRGAHKSLIGPCPSWCEPIGSILTTFTFLSIRDTLCLIFVGSSHSLESFWQWVTLCPRPLLAQVAIWIRLIQITSLIRWLVMSNIYILK
jgi:hypothetical protein